MVKSLEMKTGEGKTLVATLPCYLNALTQRNVHVVTVNDYLAKRDSQWMAQVHERLGLSVGCITNDMDDEAAAPLIKQTSPMAQIMNSVLIICAII